MEMSNLHAGLTGRGSPVFNLKGKMVGMATCALYDNDYAVGWNKCKQFVDWALKPKLPGSLVAGIYLRYLRHRNRSLLRRRRRGQ
ncbi:hypothetical protein LguiB_022723 [Lonicera macranthoides]